jgi:hypothetical protein
MRLVERPAFDLERFEEALAYLERAAADTPAETAAQLSPRVAALDRRLLLAAHARPAEGRPAPEPDRLLTVREAAAFIGMSVFYVRDHREELGVIEQGRSLRFSRRRLEAYLREHGATMRRRRR